MSGSLGSPTGTPATASFRIPSDRLVDWPFHQQPGAAHAELSGIENESANDGADGLVEIGIGEEDIRGVAAQLSGDRAEVLARQRCHVPADFGGAGEGHFV